jgi:hypothetical protein
MSTRGPPRAHLLADVEHGRLVALALADDDAAVGCRARSARCAWRPPPPGPPAFVSAGPPAWLRGDWPPSSLTRTAGRVMSRSKTSLRHGGLRWVAKMCRDLEWSPAPRRRDGSWDRAAAERCARAGSWRRPRCAEAGRRAACRSGATRVRCCRRGLASVSVSQAGLRWGQAPAASPRASSLPITCAHWRGVRRLAGAAGISAKLGNSVRSPRTPSSRWATSAGTGSRGVASGVAQAPRLERPAALNARTTRRCFAFVMSRSI